MFLHIQQKKKTKKQKKKIQRKMFTPMTNDEKEKLESMKDVVDGFEDFLISLGDSDQNRRQVLRQARKMLSGQGVEHPRNDAWFRRNEPVHLGCNFGQLIEDAWDFENTYGEDYGHGWLLRHPLKKLWLYQSQLMWDNEQEGKDNTITTTTTTTSPETKNLSIITTLEKKKAKSNGKNQKQTPKTNKKRTNKVAVLPTLTNNTKRQRVAKVNESSYEIGTRIYMVWPDKRTYFGEVTDVSKHKQKKYTVEWEDGTETINLKYSQLSRAIEV